MLIPDLAETKELRECRYKNRNKVVKNGRESLKSIESVSQSCLMRNKSKYIMIEIMADVIMLMAIIQIMIFDAFMLSSLVGPTRPGVICVNTAVKAMPTPINCIGNKLILSIKSQVIIKKLLQERRICAEFGAKSASICLTSP